MLTDERKAELRAMWKRTPGRGLFECTSEELDFIRSIENRRDELRRYIAVTKMLKPNPDCWSNADRELIEQEIDADRYWPRWIPVSERLPAEGDDVLVWDSYWDQSFDANYSKWCYSDEPQFITICISDEDSEAYFEHALKNVTHWLPLPPKPE